MRSRSIARVVAATLLIAGCASLPGGPSVLVLPGSGKGLEAFRADEAACRQYALHQVGGREAEQAATDSAVRSAVVGTVVGAVAGAALGGDEGARVGAGTGLLVGGLAGSEAGYVSGHELQRRYDHAYIQCMYLAGHRVPVSGRFTVEQVAPARAPAATPPVHAIPPPPPGAPPPPPPDVLPR
jgi:hypothetical protein